MLATIEQKSDVTVHWPRNWRRIRTIERTGRCPSFGAPVRAKDNALVVLVDDDGVGLLSFRLSEVERPVSIIGAGGTRHENGCVLVARRGTLRRPHSKERFPVNRHSVGAFSYFDVDSGKGVIYSLPGSDPSPGLPGMLPAADELMIRHKFLAHNVGRHLQQPERTLLRSYVDWIGDRTLFEHPYLRGPRLYTDLFIRSRWTLFEAKVSTARETLRYALGQLLDYQRFFPRHPRLAVLLPAKPDPTMHALFLAKKVVVVWRSTGGAFRDSSEGILTTRLRHAVQHRASVRWDTRKP